VQHRGQAVVVASSERRRDRALAAASTLRRELGIQIRIARRANGLSLRAAGGSVGLDFSKLARMERGQLAGVSIEDVALACASVGLAPSMRALPAGDAVRDQASLRLLARFRARLPRDVPWETEVPMPFAGDLRAVDARTRLANRTIGVEAETQLYGIQGQTRRALLKKRDAHLDVLILVVSDTARNRSILKEHREGMRGSFPLDTRAVLQALARGDAQAADGLVVL
jgi:transcriptional regulator with XRE-family HTH domain